MDGIVDNQFIRSLKKDGYHRLYREFEKKNTLTNQLVGSNLNYNGKYCELGLTAVYNVFNKPLNPEKTRIYLCGECGYTNFANK